MCLSKLDWTWLLHWCYQLQGIPFKKGPSDIPLSAPKKNGPVSSQINLLPLKAIFKTTLMHIHTSTYYSDLACKHISHSSCCHYDVEPFLKNSSVVFHVMVYLLHNPKSSSPHHILLVFLDLCLLLPNSPASEDDQHAATWGAAQWEKFNSLSNKVLAYQMT